MAKKRTSAVCEFFKEPELVDDCDATGKAVEKV